MDLLPNKMFDLLDSAFKSIDQWNTKAPVANNIDKLDEVIIDILNNVPTMKPADGRDFKSATPLFKLKNGNVVKTYKNLAGFVHVFMGNYAGEMVFGGYVNWDYSQYLKETLVRIRQNYS